MGSLATKSNLVKTSIITKQDNNFFQMIKYISCEFLRDGGSLCIIYYNEDNIRCRLTFKIDIAESHDSFDKTIQYVILDSANPIQNMTGSLADKKLFPMKTNQRIELWHVAMIIREIKKDPKSQPLWDKGYMKVIERFISENSI